MEDAYIQFIHHEQERVGSVLRDRETMAQRKLSPTELVLEHFPDRVADNLVWDGTGWRLHMHLAPYGNGLLFEVVVSPTGEVLDLVRPMGEQFPIRIWYSTVFVDLHELVATRQVAPDIVEDLTRAARGLAVEHSHYRKLLEARIATPFEQVDRVVTFPAVAADAPRSLAVLNFTSPISLECDFVVRHSLNGIRYQSRPFLRSAPSSGCVSACVGKLGVDAKSFLAALAEADVATAENPASARPVEIRVGTGLVGEATRLDVGRIVRGRGIGPALRKVDPGSARAVEEALFGFELWTDSAGRRVHHALTADESAAEMDAGRGARIQSLSAILAADPEAWFGNPGGRGHSQPG